LASITSNLSENDKDIFAISVQNAEGKSNGLYHYFFFGEKWKNWSHLDSGRGFPNPLSWVLVKCLVEVWVKKLGHPGIWSCPEGSMNLGQNFTREFSRSVFFDPFCSVGFAVWELSLLLGPNRIQKFPIFGT
jgi:hypothetical protein